MAGSIRSFCRIPVCGSGKSLADAGHSDTRADAYADPNAYTNARTHPDPDTYSCADAHTDPDTYSCADAHTDPDTCSCADSVTHAGTGLDEQPDPDSRYFRIYADSGCPGGCLRVY